MELSIAERWLLNIINITTRTPLVKLRKTRMKISLRLKKTDKEIMECEP
jgi:hypothetical protein